MNWTEMLTVEVEGTFGATFGLLDLVEDDTLSWKPEFLSLTSSPPSTAFPPWSATEAEWRTDGTGRRGSPSRASTVPAWRHPSSS